MQVHEGEGKHKAYCEYLQNTWLKPNGKEKGKQNKSMLTKNCSVVTLKVV